MKIVPTLCVGMPPRTLCVPLLLLLGTPPIKIRPRLFNLFQVVFKI